MDKIAPDVQFVRMVYLTMDIAAHKAKKLAKNIGRDILSST